MLGSVAEYCLVKCIIRETDPALLFVGGGGYQEVVPDTGTKRMAFSRLPVASRYQVPVCSVDTGNTVRMFLCQYSIAYLTYAYVYA